MGYHNTTHHIEKILALINCKIREVITMKFNKCFINNKNKVLFELLQNIINYNLKGLDTIKIIKLNLLALDFS